MQSDVLEIVSSYPKLAARLVERPQDRARMEKLVAEIQGDFSPAVVKTLSTFIESTFLKLYDGINLDLPNGTDLAKLQETHHVVLVPNHQSHADYVALTYVLWKNFGLPVYVAGGINLNIFPIGAMFRKAGAFYIRRSFNSDILYKLTFEAYIYFLLKKNLLVEFFFEGGRTRTGKLMKPRYGLFQMLLEAHSQIHDSKPFMFIPVALAHEYIPEAKAHARELGGGKKVAEKPTQLLKLFKLFNKRLGTIHVRFGEGIEVPGYVGEIKRATQELAFECFKAVGRGMPVTPSSLLALVMLDEPSGALTWRQIEEKAHDVIDYCLKLNIPITPSLKDGKLDDCLRSALDMFIGNKKIDLIKREKLNQVFYAVKSEARVEVLFHKNMILHHFLVPGFINAAWFKIFSGEIKTSMQLTRFLQQQRNELKYDFYLPSIKEMILHARDVVAYAVGRPIHDLDEALSFNPHELYQLASRVRHFSTAFSYLYEAYYLSAIGLKYLAQETFNSERFLQVTHELFSLELEHGRVVKYPESYSVPILKDTLDYLQNQDVLVRVDGGKFKVTDVAKVDLLIEKFLRDLNDQVAINLKFNRNPTLGNDSTS
ncbi:MAG: 1-acyl-sn-glycerol-3-phosphate acyltransferase [Bacteriovoracaceae bacterium]|nr:1-acyl-sn-glycerol-3-phosphate acyltransferase [Bacteriovoracaceae bacterium]